MLFQREGVACGDERPSPEHSCAEQARWGKCGQPWMRGFCCASCGQQHGSAAHEAAATAAGGHGQGQSLRGYVAETLDEDWRPLPSAPVAIGHQFEWATLLSLAAELHALPAAEAGGFMAVARQLLETGLRIGYDDSPGGGGVFYWADAASDGGRVVKSPWEDTSPQRKEYWVQAEALRAFSRFGGPLTSDGLPLYGDASPEAAADAEAGGGGSATDLWPRFTQTLAFVRESLVDSRYGGWFQYYDPATNRRPLDKGNAWKSGYHVVTAHLEVLRWCPSDH